MDKLTATPILQIPSSCHFLACLQAVSNTHSPIGTIRPVSSAIGINVAGEIHPFSGCFHRIKASTEYNTTCTVNQPEADIRDKVLLFQAHDANHVQASNVLQVACSISE